MDDKEKQDLEVLKTEQARIKEACWSFLGTLDGLTREKLDLYGFRNQTNAEAMQTAYRSYQKQIKKLVDDHVRRYPDD